MHGVPVDLPLENFVGSEVNQICLGQFQIQLNCSGVGSISVEGHWELRDEAGILIDSAQEHAERNEYCIHKIIDILIVRFVVEPPHSFTLFFESGLALTVFDDSERYESFSICLDGKPGIYV